MYTLTLHEVYWNGDAFSELLAVSRSRRALLQYMQEYLIEHKLSLASCDPTIDSTTYLLADQVDDSIFFSQMIVDAVLVV